MNDQDKNKNYTQSAFNQGEDRIKDALSQAEDKMKQGQEQVTRWATDMDKKTRENPWPLVAGVAVGGLLLGLILGKSKN